MLKQPKVSRPANRSLISIRSKPTFIRSDAVMVFTGQRLLLSVKFLAEHRSGLRLALWLLAVAYPTMPSADFSRVFSVSHPKLSLGPLRHRARRSGYPHSF